MGNINGLKTYGGKTRTEMAKKRLSNASNWIGKKAGELKGKYEKYQKEAPQRREAATEEYTSKTKLEKAKNQYMKTQQEGKKYSASYTFGGFAGPTTKKPSPDSLSVFLGGSPSSKAKTGNTPQLNIFGSQKHKNRKRKNISQELRGMGL